MWAMAIGTRSRALPRPPASAAGVRGPEVTELARRPGVQDVVDHRRAAAQLGLGDLPQVPPGDAAQQLAGLGAHTLRVGQMAGVVVRDGDLQRVRGALGLRRVVDVEVGVLLQVRRG